ncbi:MAG: N-sulfoglucosamine sulfohydrolase [Actinomycetota bacterium]|nr:N-sulfoglucosamine sulfohydrolase [Actinomycetota bacterium]
MPYPNILYLHSHDTGRYVQPYGYAIPTPNIQQLADEGVVFRQAFCAASTCSASRACLLTGQYAHANGMLGLAHRGWSLNDYRHHIVHTLRTVGYHSTLIGEQHISKRPDIIGYDRVMKIDTTRVDDVAPAAIDFLEGPPPQPFFLSVGFFETHRQFFTPQPGAEQSVRPPANLQDTPETRLDMASFVESARSLDAGIGRVLETLEAQGLAENTLVICTTDHGIAFPGAKATMTDGGIGVFLIMRGPGFPSGMVTDALVSQVDIYPTICQLIGIDVPDFVQGRSMMPVIEGRATTVRDAVFAEGTYHAAYEPQRSIRTRDWKYVRRFDDRTEPVLPNVDDSAGKEMWIERGWPSWLLDREQLYDLVLDPYEMRNVVEDPANAAVVTDLAARLEQWMRETGDPLLQGPVAPPPGAELNDPDQRSADDPRTLVDGPV